MRSDVRAGFGSIAAEMRALQGTIGSLQATMGRFETVLGETRDITLKTANDHGHLAQRLSATDARVDDLSKFVRMLMVMTLGGFASALASLVLYLLKG